MYAHYITIAVTNRRMTASNIYNCFGNKRNEWLLNITLNNAIRQLSKHELVKS